ncbi:MAG: DUF5685 family protein [Christensenellaceae bacterium]|nr:DUF5685 family protein [Christensenellaceae bacterium]
MFGYLRPFRPKLSVYDDALFRAYYCGVCAELGAVSPPCRLLLRYDLAFFAALKDAFAPEGPRLQKTLCPGRLRRLPAVRNEASRLGAELHLLLFAEALRDERRDGGVAAGLALPFFAGALKRAETARPEIASAILLMDEGQAALETARCDDLDEASEPFSRFMAGLFAAIAPEWAAETLRWMGLCLGRWVYWIDALDDFARDQKTGNYNVLLQKGWSREESAERLLPLLALCEDEALAAFELTEAPRNGEIVKNVLQWGLPAVSLAIGDGRPLGHSPWAGQIL